MKRTVLVLMTALTIAVLIGGHAGPVLAQTDTACLSLAISGASGRSVCENSWFATWTWTAPATGPVTFDTEGSDVDLLLTVLDLDGTFQGEMRFSAQQGQQYGIFARRTNDSIDPGTIVLNWRPSSSGGDDMGPVEAGPPLRERAVDSPAPGKPGYVLAGQNASLQYWKDADGAVSQALYRSADDTVSVRTFYDETTGLPHRVSDELSGNWLLIQENGADSVDFWFYGHDGSYRNGLAVFEDAGRYYVGEIAGLPIHAGKEITGDLVPTTASWTGSFTLDVDTGDLKTRQPVAAEIAELMDDLAPDDTLLGGLTLGGMMLLGLVDNSSGDAVAPADTAAFEALAGGKVVVFTYTDGDRMASVEFLSAGRFVWTDQDDSQRGHFSYVNTGPDTGTITLTFDPDNDPDEYAHVFEVTFTSRTRGAYASTYTEEGQEPVAASGHFKIVDWVAPDGIANAVAAALVTSLFVPDVAAGNRYKCTRLRNATSRDVCRLAADFLAHEDTRGPTGLVHDGVDWVTDHPGDLRNRIDRGKQALENVVGELLPEDAVQEQQDAAPLSPETPPPIGSRVSGEASGPGGTVAQVEGDIKSNGDFAVTGEDSKDLPVVIHGTVRADDTTAPTLTGSGASPLRAALGSVVAAADTSGDSAVFEWGGDSGRARSVRSAVVLHGNAPVVVRKIQFLKGPRDGRAVTLDLSEYFSDPNGDAMRFTAVASSSQKDIDVRVSGSMLSIRQTTPDLNLTTRIRVTATDSGGLGVEMSFPVRTSSPQAVLWTSDHDLSPGSYCGEWVIRDPEAYARHRLRGDDHPVYIPHPIDRRFGELKCTDGFCHESDGLNCPASHVSDGGCHHTFDWGTYTWFWWHLTEESRQEDQPRQREGCRRDGHRWITQRPQSPIDLLQKTEDAIRDWIIKYFDVPGSRGRNPRSTGVGARG